jgi:hypothetical protein
VAKVWLRLAWLARLRARHLRRDEADRWCCNDAVFSRICMFTIPWSRGFHASSGSRAIVRRELGELRGPAFVVLDVGEEGQTAEREVRDEPLRESGGVRMCGKVSSGPRDWAWEEDRASAL